MKYFVIFDDEKLSLFRVDRSITGSTEKVLVIKDEHNVYRGFKLYPIAINLVQHITELKRHGETNRLETEIENHRMRAVMCENVGNTNEAKDEWYLYDCLSSLKNIQDCGDCNVCASKKDCQYVPKAGQMVRFNCPFYKKEGD